MVKDYGPNTRAQRARRRGLAQKVVQLQRQVNIAVTTIGERNLTIVALRNAHEVGKEKIRKLKEEMAALQTKLEMQANTVDFLQLTQAKQAQADADQSLVETTDEEEDEDEEEEELFDEGEELCGQELENDDNDDNDDIHSTTVIKGDGTRFEVLYEDPPESMDELYQMLDLDEQQQLDYKFYGYRSASTECVTMGLFDFVGYNIMDICNNRGGLPDVFIMVTADSIAEAKTAARTTIFEHYKNQDTVHVM